MKINREEKMNPERKTSIIVGVSFIMATASSIIGTFGFLESILSAPDYLIRVSENQIQLIIGVLIDAINSVAVVAIAVMLFPILKKFNEALAIGYVSSRIIESVILIVGHISQLSLVPLSLEYVQAGALEAAYFLPSGTLLQAVSVWTWLLGPTIVLGITALILNQILYQSRLVPRWISGWGLIGGTMIIAAGLLAMVGVIGTKSSIFFLLSAPIALNEMVLAVWLIVKGFNSSSIVSGTARTDSY
jgi:hypothetical protein